MKVLQLILSTVIVVVRASVFYRCHPFQHEICHDLGYNQTILPNFFKQNTSEIAAKTLESYREVLLQKIGCYYHLREFLCMLYFPKCIDPAFYLPPCRSFCTQAKLHCEDVFISLNLTWPKQFKCSQFSTLHELRCFNGDESSYGITIQTRPVLSDQTPSSVTTRRSNIHVDVETAAVGPTLKECIGDADCLAMDSVCRDGECVCEYPKFWGQHGCQETQILGGPCTKDEECYAVTSNSVCDKICICSEPLSSYKNLACIHASEVGELCYNQAQCAAKNEFSFCKFIVPDVVGTCVCDHDQFIDYKGRCTPRIGGRCTKGLCSKILGKATCSRDGSGVPRCKCRLNTVQKGGTCVPIRHNGW